MSGDMSEATRKYDMRTLAGQLRVKSDMINMGERIEWGSETALMDEAADTIEALQAKLREAEGALEDIADGMGETSKSEIGRHAPAVARAALAAIRGKE